MFKTISMESREFHEELHSTRCRAAQNVLIGTLLLRKIFFNVKLERFINKNDNDNLSFDVNWM